MPINPKYVLPLALGVSLVSVTAFVVYYVLKKENEKSYDKAIKSSKVNVIEINVPKSIVPALIGRNGSNIKEIENKSGAIIHFKKFSDKDYDVCIVRGRTDTTQLAETFIHDFIRQQPDIIEDTMEVPAWACGRIIGVGGENINDISHRSGARVKIEVATHGDRASQRKATFRGTKEQIAVAKELVQNHVSQEKCRREIEQSKRSPRHASMAEPEEPSGDKAHKHVKYKPERSGAASIEVYVSAVSSPSRFWVQFVGPQVAQLDELVAFMTEYYGDRDRRASHQLSQVSVGQVVAAVFRHDGRWYRALVHDIVPNEFDATKQVADVFYVDYGDSEYVAVNELCELRADLLRLRFQAMECFLAGVKPVGKEQDVVGVTKNGQRWDRWNPQAIERFEELAQVARWKSLVSRTCTYKKTATVAGEKEKEIPGIKLYDVTDEGELDIGATLIAEGLAVEGEVGRPAPSTAPRGPFGDLGSSRVLSMLAPSEGRASSLPKDHKDDGTDQQTPVESKGNERITTSKSQPSDLEKTAPLSVSNFDLTQPDLKPKQLNGSHNDFLDNERRHLDNEGSTETLVPSALQPRDDFKANMNRIDSHHSNLATLDSHHSNLATLDSHHSNLATLDSHHSNLATLAGQELHK